MIKCALISGKHMGMMHASNFNNHDEAEVVALSDTSSESLKESLTLCKKGIPPAFTSTC